MSKKPRNPVAKTLRDPKYRPQVAKSSREVADRNDPWSKNAKHKKPAIEESYPTTLAEFYQVGDKVEIVSGPLRDVLARAEKLSGDKNPEGLVREPNGPSDTIGITVDGEYHLCDEDDLRLITEGFGYDYEDLTEWSYAETLSGIPVMISSEERSVLDKCDSPMMRDDLDYREQEVARKMVSRGVLHRRKNSDGVYFISDNKKLTRF